MTSFFLKESVEFFASGQFFVARVSGLSFSLSVLTV